MTQSAITRYPDWDSRLARFLHECKDRRFDGDSFNCGLFVCDALEAMTGVDIGAEFRGRENLMDLTPRIEELFDRIGEANDFREIPVSRAHRGDVVLFPLRPAGEKKALGIVGLDGAATFVGDGLQLVPLSRCLRARRVTY